jgi:hypothetical protein
MPAGSFKKDRGVSHLGTIASAGAAQASAAPITPPTAAGLAKSQDVLVEITGSAFANLPVGGSCQVGDMLIVYTKTGITPTINCAVGDTLLGGAVVYAAGPLSHTFRVIEVTAGVATWIVEK